MASSSSSSHFIPASVSQSWNHDVFLSFRGEDTRKGFVDHLYTALVQQGIHTYKDDETLDRGETIGPALFKAIQESRIAIIVFSKNYANSSWCLDELAYIIECMENKGQVAMPVFYDVDPSDVRKQNGKYGEAFDKHDQENKHKVESWRKALLKAGNLSGWVPNDFASGHETKCIKDIVSAISGRLTLQITNINKDIIGIETRLLDLKSKLKIGSGGVRMVEIWGVGGGGKSTLASAAYTEISHQFESRCLLENIREESSKHGLKGLQEIFLSFILKTKVELESEIEGKNMIKRRLCHKTVLVVLDDVDDLKQLKALAGSHDWFGEGSRIIITTRDEHLLTRKADTIYEVSLLSQDEAIKLLSRHAYREVKPIEDYETLSQDVVSYAGGLPLALEVLGSFLYDKDEDEWRSVLAKLKLIPDVKVTERLKISYDALESYEKELFLDIACFMRRWEIDEAMRVLDACSFHPRVGVKVLIQKSLIKVSNGRFDMHDLVEEMAHYIVRGAYPNHPEKHNRIWQKKDVVYLCDMGVAASLMEIEVLALHNDPRFHINVRDLRLLDVFANMKKLRWINWDGYVTSSLTSSFGTNFQPTMLGCLVLKCSWQKELWKGCKHLPNLKILDLTDSMKLIRTPNFNGLPCLERLILKNCYRLKEIHRSIGYHERLVLANMKNCSKLKTFPPIIRMKKLETLDLSSCSEFQKFPDIQSNMDRLVNLDLNHTNVEIIPSSVGQFCTNLVSFCLEFCFKLKRIEGNFRLLKSLKYLQLAGCCRLEKLVVDFFDKECCLEVLSLSIKSQDSTSLKNRVYRICLQRFSQNTSVSLKLPQFPRLLRKLDLSWCDLGDGDIPYDMSGLLNLQELDLSCNDFSRLHCLSRIPCLKFLDLSFSRKLVEFPELPSSIAILKANNCESLESIGDLSNYKWLWKVSLRRNNKLIGSERVPHPILQRNAVEDRFTSVTLPGLGLPLKPITISDTTALITLQLPHNWYSDFGGFLLCGSDWWSAECSIVIKHEMSMDSQPDHDHWEEFHKNPESYKECAKVGYIPFASLSHIPWWNSAYTEKISLEIIGICKAKVGLVPRKSKLGDSRDNCSDRWEEDYEYRKAFEITGDLKSSKIEITWQHS